LRSKLIVTKHRTLNLALSIISRLRFLLEVAA
jgi:hypothetical protein